MDFNVHISNKLLEEHRQDLRREMEHQRMLASLPHRSMRRWLAGRLGVLLVALGTRLENYEHVGKPVAYDLVK